VSEIANHDEHGWSLIPSRGSRPLQECKDVLRAYVGLLTIPVVDGCTGPVTRVRIPSHALIFAEPLWYGCGVAQPVTTRWLTAVYGHHTGKYLSSTRRAIYS
jgi:hypothetical protein